MKKLIIAVLYFATVVIMPIGIQNVMMVLGALIIALFCANEIMKEEN